MHRYESRKNKLIKCLIIIFAFISLFTLVRVILAGDSLTGKDLSKVTGEYGTVTDRQGNILYDGACSVTATANLIGNPLNTNTIANVYSEALAPSGFNVVSGIKSVEGKAGQVLQTTLLSADIQERLARAFGKYNGVLFAYNYTTGEILCALSLPSSSGYSRRDGALINKCLDGTYIPGSTMKIVASILALEQDLDLAKHRCTCTGTRLLPDGTSVSCAGGTAHGTVNLETALGYSCNCYFSSLISRLDVDQTQASLLKLGFTLDGENKRTQLSQLTRTTSSTNFTSNESFNDVWSLIGQGHTQISVVDMVKIAGAVSNGGVAAEPYLVSSICDPNESECIYEAETDTARLFTLETAEDLDAIWENAVNRFYRSGSSAMSTKITYAKTGTAELGDGTTNRTLLGVIKEQQVAFMIVVEGLPSGDPLCVTIANTLASVLG